MPATACLGWEDTTSRGNTINVVGYTVGSTSRAPRNSLGLVTQKRPFGAETGLGESDTSASLGPSDADTRSLTVRALVANADFVELVGVPSPGSIRSTTILCWWRSMIRRSVAPSVRLHPHPTTKPRGQGLRVFRQRTKKIALTLAIQAAVALWQHNGAKAPLAGVFSDFSGFWHSSTLETQVSKGGY